MRRQKRFTAHRLWSLLGLAAMVLLMAAVFLISTADAAPAKKKPNKTADYPAIGPLPKPEMPEAALVAMGKRLFFDARISANGAIRCATCHDPAEGFGKLIPLANGYSGNRYFRNTPTLVNTRYKADFANVGWGWDGRIGANLNDVIKHEITATTLMNMDQRLMQERAKQDPVYVKMCADNFAAQCSASNLRQALVAFVETLVSQDVPFDQGKLSHAAKRGRVLFEGEARCITCHNGPYFSDGQPHNTGVPENMTVFEDPVRHLIYRAVLQNHGVPKRAQWRRDVGYFMVSKKQSDVGKFITPTLRELKYTAPYMHNGTLATLIDVVSFYGDGGGHDDRFPSELQPLKLSAREQSDLVAFLESLSSKKPVTVEWVTSPPDYPPQQPLAQPENDAPEISPMTTPDKTNRSPDS